MSALKNTTSRKGTAAAAAILITALILAGCISISSFIPKEGSPGDTVTINGSGFGATPAENTVQFADVAATTISVPVPGKKILATVPAGARTGLISVRNTIKSETATSKENFRINTGWTFLVYLDADNNLELDGLNDFREMAEVGSSANIRIVVQMDRAGRSTSYGNWADTRRFLIQHDDTPAAAPLMDMGELNMGDPAVLEDFVEWGIRNYPAKYYALIVWNHGGGWKMDVDKNMEKAKALKSANASRAESDVLKAVCTDETSGGDQLFMYELRQALNNAKASTDARLGSSTKLDLIGFDACLMGMIEVAYQLRDLCGVMIGSEDTEPGAGWPYNTILTQLASAPLMQPADLAGMIVEKYYSSYGASDAITQAALDMSKLNALVSAVDAFTVKATTEWDKLRDARTAAKQYHPYAGYNAFWGMDIKDFFTRTSNLVVSTEIKNACSAVNTALDQAVINEMHGTGDANSNGLAIYFPKTKADYDADIDYPGYETGNTVMPVDYVRYHSWSTWLKTYYAHIP
jgi:hypothetical protein